jgi:hypothetical protein
VYVTYYDIGRDVFPWYLILAGPAGAFLPSVLIAIIKRFPFLQIGPWPPWLMRFIGVCFGVGWTALGVRAWMDFRTASQSFHSGSCQVVEGTVTDFEPLRTEVHKDEHFAVNGVAFFYSSRTLAPIGFHQDASVGGPIRPGLPVRICYWPSDHGGNHIVSLAIRSE